MFAFNCFVIVSNISADDLDYDKMAVLTFELPSGHTLDNVEQARTDNPGAVRLELDKDKVHLYMTSVSQNFHRFMTILLLLQLVIFSSKRKIKAFHTSNHT